jgi:PAS domain S-box-containing protein
MMRELTASTGASVSGPPAAAPGAAVRWLAWTLVASLAYFAAARIGTALHLPSTRIAIAWPASGLALAAFHLQERRRWWLLALGIGLANLFANWAVGAPFTQNGFATVADLLEAAGGALVLERIARRRADMTAPEQVIALCLIAVTVTPLCAALATAVPAAGETVPFFDRWRQWTIVDGVGIVFVAPALLGAAGWLRGRRRFTARRALELGLLLTGTVVTSWVAVSADVAAPESALTSRYLVFPWLAIAALRAGPAGAGLTVFGMSAAAIAAAISSTRVLSHDAAVSVVLALQLFISVATLTTLGISTLEARRRQARRALLRANHELEARTTELEREVQRRSESEARVAGLKDDLADTIDSMPLALIALDRDDVVRQWNRRADEVVGLDGARALGMPARELLAAFWPAIELSRANKHAPAQIASERVHLERDGAARTYAVTFYPLARGYLQGGVVMIGDVTEQDRLQDVIRQTEKMISLGGLAAGMAHEINNPLGIVAQAAQNVQRRTSAELPANRAAAEAAGVSLDGLQRYFEARGIHQFIADIRVAAARAATIVSNMLEFSRKSPSAKGEVKLNDVLDRALVLAASDFDLRKQYDFRRVEIVRHYTPDLPPVHGMVIELEQVFLNLIKNAAQAMATAGQSEPRLQLGTRAEEGYAVVTVEDNGPGMDESTRRRVFEPFFTTKDPGVGTGLGLSVSFAIVTGNHKGTISVQSVRGSGATFTLRLPFAAEGAS